MVIDFLEETAGDPVDHTLDKSRQSLRTHALKSSICLQVGATAALCGRTE
jgi:hypothetical protein